MASTRLIKNDFPEIIAQLNSPEMTAVLLAGAESIAEVAAAKAPVASGALRDSIEAKPVAEGNVGIFMAWYGRFVEHGTVNAPPHPFLVPAAEAGRVTVAESVAAFLRSL